ncbi:MAG: ribonuclease HI [Clostridia bacterium]|nr:ribonuclease HI [Clostridia bacterium]MBR6890095.1 ribonuclease HI [Clostridia bacterium]
MKQVVIYTDGACSGNPGPGGWGAILMYGEKKLEISGYEAHTTNNRMELMAPIQALSRLKEPCIVRLYSDSAYLVNAFEKRWLDSWQRHNWLKSDKKPVENQDLWQALLKLAGIHKISWIKVKGHADNPYNNRCDELATGEIRQHNIRL